MPRQPPSYFGSSSPSSLSPLHDTHPFRSPYGLLEPQIIAAPQSSATRRLERSGSFGSPPHPALLGRRPRRKSVSIGRDLVVPAWSEVEASLDILKDCGIELGASLGVFGGKLSDAVPGFKGSVAFLSILRSNIQLSTGVVSDSPRVHPSSVASSPNLSPPPLQLPTAPAMATESSNAGSARVDRLANIPELVYETPASSSARVDGLKLVADSVAQMRQTAAATIIGSPLSLAFVVAVPVLLYIIMYKQPSDYFHIFLTTMGVIMSMLVGVRMVLRGYIDQAEAIDWKWLDDDHMLVARFGSDIIGTLIYNISEDPLPDGLASGTSLSPSKSTRRQNMKVPRDRKAKIRAWTIRRRERGHGVGMPLLEAAVKRCFHDHKCSDVQFADAEGGRAGSKRVVNPILAGSTNLESVLLRDENRAQATLQRVIERTREQ